MILSVNIAGPLLSNSLRKQQPLFNMMLSHPSKKLLTILGNLTEMIAKIMKSQKLSLQEFTMGREGTILVIEVREVTTWDDRFNSRNLSKESHFNNSKASHDPRTHLNLFSAVLWDEDSISHSLMRSHLDSSHNRSSAKLQILRILLRICLEQCSEDRSPVLDSNPTISIQ